VDKSFSNNPLVYQLINLVEKGISALDAESQAQVQQFLQNSQHENGGFVNRAGTPDLYYSLFGVWIAAAVGSDDVLEKHIQFVLKNETAKDNLADEFALLLIRAVLFQNEFRKPRVLKLLRTAFLKGNKTSVHYRIFLFLLTFDVFYSNRILRFFGRIVLPLFSPPSGSPASVHAAVIVARQTAGLKTEIKVKKLLDYFENEKGFKAFKEVTDADLLSTAVALFAFKTANADLRLVRPACLKLIQQNYRNGAFLAGNGDEICDLEYTFYGLLALGVLI
jgi:prenyltransferase beta subunit